MKNYFKKLTFVSFSLMIISFGYSQNQSLDINSSKIRWYGEQITGKKHFGDLKFSEGNVESKDGIVTSGTFTVDMTSLTVEDLSGGGKKRLEGHLRSDDFFGVTNYPKAELKISQNGKLKGDSQTLEADLTIKGVTHPVTFTMKLISENNATATLVFDRSKYNVRHRSGSFFDGLGDRLILDEIELEVTLVFN